MWIYEDHNTWQVKKWNEHEKRAVVVKEFSTREKALAFCLLYPLYGAGTFPSVVSFLN